VDSGNNVVLGCYFAGAIDFGGGAITSGGNYDPCVAKLSSTGSHVFSMGMSGTSDEGIRGLAIDTADNIVVSGYAFGDIDLGGGVLTSGAGYDVFIAKYTSAGAHVWGNLYGAGNGTQVGYGVDTNATNQIFATGYFQASIDFGSGAVSSFGSEDAYLAKLSP
jgi:hypothetical protein